MYSKSGWLISASVVLAVLTGLVVHPWSGQSSGPSQVYAQQLLDAQAAQQQAIAGADQLSTAFRTAAKILKPSVVQINALVDQPQRRLRQLPQGQSPFGSPFGNDLFDELFRELEGRGRRQVPIEPEEQPEGPKSRVQAGVGSGVIVSEDGFVLTNNHVIEQADELQIRLSDGQEYKAEIVGRDPSSDVAVLKIDATGLAAAKLGDSSAIEVGDWVIAVGSPFGLEQTVTAGIISATNRRTGILRGGFEDFLQTDAAINPGNSGGPLVNLRGEVVGINTAINSRTGTNAGVGFAIPSNMALQIMQDLRSTGRVVRGFIGAGLDELTPESARELKLPNNIARGAIIRKLLPDGPAARAEMKEKDVVIGIGNRPITSSSQLMNEIAMVRPGSQIELKVLRDGKPRTITITVEERTEEKMSQFSDRTVIEDWGLALETLTPELAKEVDVGEDLEAGAVIVQLDRTKRAAKLGLQPADVIVAIDGKPIRTAAEAKQALSEVGKQISLQARRGHIDMSLTRPVPPK
ncbi:MAG: Do family serine endopeptidase [Pirellulaceae bacterium]|nr:Do family serine endopeptidase [Pirellulaceae bacterium]